MIELTDIFPALCKGFSNQTEAEQYPYNQTSSFHIHII